MTEYSDNTYKKQCSISGCDKTGHIYIPEGYGDPDDVSFYCEEHKFWAGKWLKVCLECDGEPEEVGELKPYGEDEMMLCKKCGDELFG